MGNCPSEFAIAPNGFACIVQCPASKNYELRNTAQGLSCTYTADPSISVPLNVLPAFQQNPPGPPISYKNLSNKAIYQAEIDRFNNAIAIADAKIDKEIKLKTAFKALQDAENVRDKAPDAYQNARVTYYKLVKGDTWVEEEKARIANVEAQPVVDRIARSYTDIQAKRDQQRSTLEVANGIRDKLLSVKGDLQYSVSAFQKQIREIKNQISMDKKKQIEVAKENNSWIDSLLNWLIAIATIVAIVTVVQYLRKPRVQTSVPSPMIPR